MGFDYSPDRYFFHYTTRKAAFEQILPSRRLRFSLYDQMRDPIENKKLRIGAGQWVADRGKDFEVGSYFQFLQLANYIRQRRSHLLALTVDAPGYEGADEPFGRGWARARMWENYAEKHAGVCLMFDKTALTKTIHRSLAEQELASPYHGPVEYTNTGSADLTLDLESLSDGVSPQSVAKYIEEHNRDLFFLKTEDWRTEYEYRFVTTTADGGNLFVDYGDALEALVVGEAFPTWERAGALEECRIRGAEALRLDWSVGAPIPATLKLESDFHGHWEERIRLHQEEAERAAKTNLGGSI